MKKPIYLYILVGLSTLGSIIELVSFFLGNKITKYPSTGNAEQDKLFQSQVNYLGKLFDFTHSAVNISLAVLLFALLLVTIYFLVKKSFLYANYAYIASLFLSVGKSLYTFIYMKSVVNLISDPTYREFTLTGNSISQWISLGLFAIFLLLVLYKLWRYNQAQSEVEA